MAIITPAIAAAYLVWQISKRDLRGWQHYACLTSLIFLISILFLVASGKVKRIDVAGNTLEVIDQKVKEIIALTEQNKQMAKATVELILFSANTATNSNSRDPEKIKRLNELARNVLRDYGMSGEEILRYSQTNNILFRIPELNK